MLTESNDKLVQFGIGGLCNLCLGNVRLFHPEIQVFILT